MRDSSNQGVLLLGDSLSVIVKEFDNTLVIVASHVTKKNKLGYISVFTSMQLHEQPIITKASEEMHNNKWILSPFHKILVLIL